MSNNHTALEQITTTIPPTDGWDDAAAEEAGRIIRGTLMKFVDWRWYAGAHTVSSLSMSFLS
jgi:hypothetical protein